MVTVVPAVMAMVSMMVVVSTKPVNAVAYVRRHVVGQHVTEVTPMVMVAPIMAVSATVMSVPVPDLLHDPRVALDCCRFAHCWQSEHRCCAQTDQDYGDG